MTGIDKYLHAVIMRADIEARDDGSATVEAQHLLLAIAAEREPTTRKLLDSAGLDHRAIRDALTREFDQSLRTVGVSLAGYDLPPPSPAADHPKHPKMGATGKLALERAFSSVPRKKDLRPAHVLLGVLRAQAGTVPRALELAGVDLPALTERVRQTLTERTGDDD